MLGDAGSLAGAERAGTMAARGVNVPQKPGQAAFPFKGSRNQKREQSHFWNYKGAPPPFIKFGRYVDGY